MRFIAERQENIETHDTICGTVETQETQDIGARCIGKGEVECSIHSSGTITFNTLAKIGETGRGALCASLPRLYLLGIGCCQRR